MSSWRFRLVCCGAPSIPSTPTTTVASFVLWVLRSANRSEGNQGPDLGDRALRLQSDVPSVLALPQNDLEALRINGASPHLGSFDRCKARELSGCSVLEIPPALSPEVTVPSGAE